MRCGWCCGAGVPGAASWHGRLWCCCAVRLLRWSWRPWPVDRRRQVGLPVLAGEEPRWRFRTRAALKDFGRRDKTSLRHGCCVADLVRFRGVTPAIYKAARNRSLTRGQKLSNTALAAVRAPVEHGFAHLKNWRVLGKVSTDPAWATALVRALLMLTNREVAR
ncbi:transposase family protein [Streptomyces viridosporus]|uniref:transposase family protein n=1 Tax=Streptomyces viridosporus TaxID=67581 RepID=UPI0036F8CC7E